MVGETSSQTIFLKVKSEHISWSTVPIKSFVQSVFIVCQVETELQTTCFSKNTAVKRWENKMLWFLQSLLSLQNDKIVA